MENLALSLNFKHIGKDVTIWPLAKIINPEIISIGDSVIIDDFVFIMGGAKTIIGSFVHIGSHTSVAGGGDFVMNDFSGLSGGVRIYTGNEDYSGGSMTNPAVPEPFRVAIRSFVRIEKHAIVGANTVILPGVVISEGVAIGSNSLVTKNCEPWTIYAGSPARAIKDRPSEKILQLEAQLRAELYDIQGNYISRKDRKK